MKSALQNNNDSDMDMDYILSITEMDEDSNPVKTLTTSFLSEKDLETFFTTTLTKLHMAGYTSWEWKSDLEVNLASPDSLGYLRITKLISVMNYRPNYDEDTDAFVKELLS